MNETTEYPYFVAPLLEALEKATEEHERQRLRHLIAVNVGDEEVLRDLFHLDSASLVNFYPDMTSPELTTNDTIDSFLDRYGNRESRESRETALPAVPVVPVMDYASMMMGEEEDPVSGQSGAASEVAEDASTDSDQARIDAFLSANPAPRMRPAKPRRPAAAEPETPALTESFARIMIKNGNYSKALEIITELNLKNPEKSIYFADQIRFLRKLIINEQKNKV